MTILETYDPDLGERLHRELSDTALPALDPLDPLALTAAGGRALRRQQGARALGAAAAVLAVGVAGYATLGSFAPDRVNLPAASPSTSSTTPAATAPVTVRLDPLGGVATSSGPGNEIRIAVTWKPTTGPQEADLIYSTYAPSGPLAMTGGSSTKGLGSKSITWGTGGPQSHILVGILPASARWFTVVTPTDPAGGHMSTVTQKAIPGSPWQAFAAYFEDAGDVTKVRDVLWSDDRGIIRDKSGQVVPSVALDDPQHTTVYVAEQDAVMGTAGRRSGGNASVPLTGRPANSPHPVIAMSAGDNGSGDGLFAMLVPAGSTAPALTPAATITPQAPRIEPVPGTSWALLWTSYTISGPAGTKAFSKVEWTAPDGNRVTVTSY